MTNANFTRRTLHLIIFLSAALLLTVHSCYADITTGLVGHYEFEEGSGTNVNDSSGMGNNGTLVNNPPWVPGKSSAYSITFENNTGYMNLGQFAATKNANQLTYSAWVKFNSSIPSGNEYIVENHVNSVNFGITITRYSGGITCSVRTSSSVSAVKYMTADSGLWHLLTCVYNGSNSSLIMYVDAVPSLISTQSGYLMNATGSLTIPTDSSGNHSNTIDDIRIYNRSLSELDVLELYNYATSDIYPPSISSILSFVTTTTAQINWTTDETANSKVFFGLNGNYTNSTILNATLTNYHVVNIAGLIPGTTYNYVVQSQDGAGNYVNSSQRNFTTTTAYMLTTLKNGSGTILGTNIYCGANCSYLFVPNASINLTAIASPGYLFTGWSSANCSGTSICSITMTNYTNVTANFNQGGILYTGNTITHEKAGVNFTWTFNCNGRPCQYGQFVTGDYWIIPYDDLNNSVTYVTITNITPENISNGAEINPPSDSHQGLMDIYPTYYIASRNIMNYLPINVSANNSIFKAYVLNNSNYIFDSPLQQSAHCRQSQGCVATNDVLTIVDSIPADNGLSVFRPPFYGTWKPQFSTYKVMFDRLPSSSTISNELFGNIEEFANSMDDIYNRWTVAQYEVITPSDFYRDTSPIYAMNNYAAYQSGAYNGGVMSVFGNEPVELKANAVYSLMQRGIDKYAMFHGGIAFGSGAGQRLGKKPPIVFFAAMYNDSSILAEIRSITQNASFELNNYFQEDSQLKSGPNGVVVWGDNGITYEGSYWYTYFLQWKTENNWTNGGHDGGGASEDPYHYIDGPAGGINSSADGTGAGRNYQPVSTPYLQSFAFIQLIMPWLKYVNNDPEIIQYADRITDGYGFDNFNGGVWTQPDPCAAPDIRENPTCDPRSVNTCLYYTVTWGPDPANPGKCIYHSANPTYTGNGRYPQYHGAGSFSMGGSGGVLRPLMRACLDETNETYRTGVCSGMGPEVNASGNVDAYCGTTLNFCVFGTLNNYADNATHYLWGCNGIGNGTSSSCSLVIPVLVNGSCGAAAKSYSPLESFPYGAYCSTGNPNPITPIGPNILNLSVSWTCTGANGGTNIVCNASRETDPNGGAIAHWTFDNDSDGVIHDSSVNSLGGTQVGNVTWVPGIQGGMALLANGTSGYLNFGAFDVVEGINATSVSLWVKPNVSLISTDEDLFEKFTNSADHTFSAIRNYNEGFSFSVRTSSTVTASSVNGKLNSTRWHHVVGVYNGTHVLTYVDGVQSGSPVAQSGLTASPSASLNIPSNTGASHNTAIDDVQIYNRALTSAQVYAIYAAGVAVYISTPTNITTNDSVILSWTTDQDANETIRFGPTTSLTYTAMNTSFNTTHVMQLTNLQNSTLYFYNITACNATLNCTTNGPYYFATLGTSDNTSPTQTNIQNTSKTNRSIIIATTTNEASNATINYGTTLSLGVVVKNDSLSTNHMFRLSSLQNATLYYYNISYSDIFGNSATYGPYNFTTHNTYIFGITFSQSDWLLNETTNLTQFADNTSFTLVNTTFANNHGKIFFLNNISLQRDLDLTNKIRVLNNQIFVDSISLPEFNTSAQLTFRNVSLTHPIVKKDNLDCTGLNCTSLDYNITTKLFTFVVPGFSTYTLAEQCSDGVKNADETGVDCGGANCTACATPPSNGGGGSSGGGRSSSGANQTTTSNTTTNSTNTSSNSSTSGADSQSNTGGIISDILDYVPPEIAYPLEEVKPVPYTRVDYRWILLSVLGLFAVCTSVILAQHQHLKHVHQMENYQGTQSTQNAQKSIGTNTVEAGPHAKEVHGAIDELSNSLRAHLTAGYSKEQLILACVKKGWQKDTVEHIIQSIETSRIK